MSKHTKLILAIVAIFLAFAAYKTFAQAPAQTFVTCTEEGVTIRHSAPQAWVYLRWADVAKACKASQQ